jgi:GTP-binding protein
VLNHIFHSYQPYKGEIRRRGHGVLIASDQGLATAYALHQGQERGTLFLAAGVRVYAGMIVGASAREQDIELNVTRKKQLTNMRASGADEALRLEPPRVFSLEEALEFINDDELIEVTPENIRLRKKHLDRNARVRYAKAMADAHA